MNFVAKILIYAVAGGVAGTEVAGRSSEPPANVQAFLRLSLAGKRF